MSVISITPQQAVTMQVAGALILDVREPWEAQLAAIEGALHITMQMLPSSLDALPRDVALLCLCHHGIRSMHVARFLVGQGFSQIYNITGGTEAWSHSVDTSLASY